MWRAWWSSPFPGKLAQVSTGAWFRARMATPFQERSPCQTASYPRVRRAFTGKAPCSVLSSCRLTTSGSALANQAKRLSSRLLMLLMLKVATLTKPLSAPVPLDALPEGATEFVVPAGIVLSVDGNGKLRRSPVYKGSTCPNAAVRFPTSPFGDPFPVAGPATLDPINQPSPFSFQTTVRFWTQLAGIG